MLSDTEAKKLLVENPGRLVLLYTDTISEIVQFRLINTSWYSRSDKEDLTQEVIRRLLERMPVLQSQFKGKSRLETYLIRVIINICNELCREAKQSPGITDALPENLRYFHVRDLDLHNHPDFPLLDQESTGQLKRILETYPVSQHKLVLFLKILYLCPVSMKDVVNYCGSEDAESLLGFLNHHRNGESKTRSYEIMTELVSKYEGRDNTVDAVRKWLDHHIGIMVLLLNRFLETTSFDESNFRYLFEKYFVIDSKREE